MWPIFLHIWSKCVLKTWQLLKDVLSVGRFVRGTFCLWGVLTVGRFAHKTFCSCDVLSVGRFARGTFCSWDLMSGCLISRGTFGPMGPVCPVVGLVPWDWNVLWDVNFVCTPVKGAVLINLT